MVCVISDPGAVPEVPQCGCVNLGSFRQSQALFSSLEGETPGQSPLMSHPRRNPACSLRVFLVSILTSWLLAAGIPVLRIKGPDVPSPARELKHPYHPPEQGRKPGSWS